MRLIELKLKNFRCYKELTSIRINDLTCILGKNDVGKSSILDALDGFFNDTIDKGDLNAELEDGTIELTCIFDEVPNRLVLDSSVETSPIEEFLLNVGGKLELKKTFKIGKSISKAAYLIANHPTHDKLQNILSLKNSPLKNLAEEVEANLEGVNKTKNPPLRKAIREAIESDTAEIELKVDGTLDTTDNIKAIWSKLKSYLPVFSIFKVDKNIDDKDKDVQDPMKHAVRESLAIPRIVELLEEIEKEVKDKSTEVAELTIEKLKEIDESLAENLKSDFSKSPSWEKIFDLTLLNNKNIPLNKRGSGVKRLVLLSFFQAQAEKKKVENNSPSIIYAIEEPETSQHPNHQLILINSFQALSEQDSVQVLFTTHSSNLIKEIPVSSLIYLHTIEEEIQIDYGSSEDNEEINEETLDHIIKSLGVLPNPRDSIQKLIYVEGYHDINALFGYSKILFDNDETLINLEESDSVAFVIAGGSALKFYIDYKYLSGLGKSEFHLYDNDVEEYRQYVKKINDEGNPRKIAFNTTKRELENYLTKEAIEEAFADNGLVIEIPNFGDEDDVPMLVAKTIHESNSTSSWIELEESQQKRKESRIKKILNTQAVHKMTIERLENNNCKEEIESWLKTLNELN